MNTATLPRSSGILLHPTSLPGPFGIGDFGPAAERWIDTLAAARQHWWQILPLGPTGYGNSPYQLYSAFAGSVALLSPDRLVADGWIDASAIHHVPFGDRVADFDRAAEFKTHLIEACWSQFARSGSRHSEFEAFCQREQHWLDDYALFMAIRRETNGTALADWPRELRIRERATIERTAERLRRELDIVRFGQFLFDQQWTALREYARSKYVRLIGDAPIFVAADSADVWANPDEFLLTAEGKPKAVAGVPPDYFSKDGQLWGNPLYDWTAMARSGYRWWIARIKRQLDQVDLIRLDHFRGFAAAWHVPPSEKTAKNGAWVDGPRDALFEAMAKVLGTLPLIAEDLGLITPDVDALRIRFDLPGMRVLQFMLGGPENPYWPHMYQPNTVVYSGTHDNDTTAGWYATLGLEERKRLDDYVGHAVREPHWELLRLAWGSVAKLAIAPCQDWLGLDGTARMNVPGVADGNWGWRLRPEDFGPGAIERLAALTERTARVVPVPA